MSDLNQKTKNSEVKWKMLLLGMTLAFVANLIFISNMFAVGKFELGSGELCFVKGIIQTIVFGLAAVPCISSILHKKSPEARELSGRNSKVACWKPMLIVVSYGLSNALMTILVYTSLMFLPLSDVVVFSHTASIFTLILSQIFLRTRILVFNATFCIIMVLGVTLVAKPTFFFGSTHSLETNSTNNLNGSYLHNDTINDHVNKTYNDFSADNYALGVVLSLTCAFMGAVGYVTSAQSKEYNVQNNYMMISAGIATFLVSCIMPLIGIENKFLDAERISEVQFNPDLLLMIGIGLGSIFGGLLLIRASQVSPPTVVSIVRSSEILLALFIDRVILGIVGHGYYAVGGSILVLLSVIGMAGSDWIEEKMSCTKRDPESGSSESLEEEEVTSKG